jgi:hypothetical protein
MLVDMYVTVGYMISQTIVRLKKNDINMLPSMYSITTVQYNSGDNFKSNPVRLLLFICLQQ